MVFRTMDQTAQALLKAHQIYEVFWSQKYAIYVVEEDTAPFYVQLWAEGTFSCTCPYWIPQEAGYVHILASQTYQNHTLRLSPPEN